MSQPVKPVIVRTHLSLFVRDPEASAQWYADVLGMKITARPGGIGRAARAP